MSALEVAIVRLAHGLDLPAYQSAASAGLDLAAAIPDDLLIERFARAVIPTGIAIALPEGYEAQVRPRSGLAVEHGVTILNAPGTIDADYRGEIAVVLVNLGPEPFAVRRGMRIAQLVVAPVTRIVWAPTTRLPASERGAQGFGSSGTGAP